MTGFPRPPGEKDAAVGSTAVASRDAIEQGLARESASAGEGLEGEGRPDAPALFEMGGVGKHTLIYGLGILMGKALAFIMLPIYTRYLSPADYGVMGLVEMTLDIIGIAAGAQLAPSIFRFYHKAEDDEGRRDVVSTALSILAATYLTMGTVTLILAPWLSELVFETRAHTNIIRVASGSLALQSLILVPLAFARVRDRSGVFVAAQAGKLVLSAALNVLFLVGLGWGVLGVFASTLISTVVVGSVLTTWVVRTVGIRFSPRAARNLLRYGVPLMATQFATFAATFGDRYFLQSHGGSAVVGIYDLAYKFGFLLTVLGFVPFYQVWGPKRFEIAQRPDSDDLLARGFIYANLLLITAGLGITLFVDNVLHVMTTPQFYGAAAMVPVILLAYVFQSWSQAQDIGILVKERTELITLANWVAALVAIGGYWFLVPRYLGWGAAAATVVAFGVRYVLTYTISQRLWRVEYRWTPVLKLLAIAGAAAGAHYALPTEPLWLSLSLRGILFLGYLLLVWRTGVLSDTERAQVRAAAGRIWMRARARTSGKGSGPNPAAAPADQPA